MKELLAAGEQLLDAQKQALAGKRSERFEAAGKRQRDAIRTLVSAAAKLLGDAGHRPSAAVEERIASSLRAASVDPDARPLLENGRLDEDVESSGLSLLAGMAPAGGPRTRTTRPTKAQRADEIREARQTLKEARETERRLRREATAAEREVERAAAAAEQAQEQASTLAAEADAAAEVVEQAQQALEQLEKPKR